MFLIILFYYKSVQGSCLLVAGEKSYAPAPYSNSTVNRLHHIVLIFLSWLYDLNFFKTLRSVDQKEILFSEVWDPLRDVSFMKMKFTVETICFFDFIYM